MKLQHLKLLNYSALFFVLSAGPSEAVPSLPLLQQNNLVYKGAFRVPDSDSFNGSGRALAYNPLRNSLFIENDYHAGNPLLAEISIPTITRTTDKNALSRATLLQPFTDTTAADVYYNGNNHNVQPTSLPNNAHTWGVWEQLEFYAERASAPNTPNGKWIINRVGRSGGPLASYTNAITHIEGDRPWRYLAFGTGVASVYTGDVHLKVYMDDMYIDTTQTRVEVCDVSTWSSRTHCEIQPATAWADNQISFGLNRGSFGFGDTGYVFVIDEAGVVQPAGTAIF